MNQDRIEPGKFNIIYADPPWRFKNWSMDELAKRGEKWARKNGRSPYNVMDHRALCSLPIYDLAAKNSALGMWVTDPKIDEGLEVMQSWGFGYTTVLFYWIKTNPLGLKIKFGSLVNLIQPYLGKRGFEKMVRVLPDLIEGWHLGLGYHTRANPEQCWLGQRGKGLRRVDNTVPRLIVSPVGEHSQKPHEARLRIKRLYGEVPRIELFARQRAKDWSAWGNEVPGGNDIEIDEPQPIALM